MKIKVPTTWHDVTVNQYQALSQIKREEYKTDLSYTIAVLQILCELDTIIDLPLNFINEAAPLITFLSEPIPSERHTHVNCNGVSYEWIGSFNELTVGEALSIEQIIDLEDLTYALSYDVICAVLLREDGKPFDSKLFQENRNKFGALPITEVIGQILFFLNGGKLCTRGMKTYSIVKGSKGSTQMKSGKLRRLYYKIVKVVRFISGWRWLTN